jgi:DNA-binding CsgD family transcriptional regulator
MAATSVLDLIGREEELAALGEFLDAADELPGAVVLEGEAGIGKTTVLAAAREAARHRSYRILSCRTAETEAQLSFAALRDLLDDAFEEVAPGLPAPQRHALAVAMLREEPEAVRAEAGAVAAALLGSLRALASAGPLVVAVDDVQWLDGPSATVLEFAARRLRSERVALLFTRRLEGANGLPLGLDRALPESRLRRIVLGPLTLSALHSILETRLGLSFPRPVLHRVHDSCGGNPFFALELARAIQRSGGYLAPGGHLPVPANLHELVRARIAALPDTAVDALAAAAALSRPTVGLLTAASDYDPAPDLDLAVAAHVIEIEGERIRFTHPLLASAVYADVAPGKRRELHRGLADLVDDAEERARHLALTASGPAAEVAAALDEAAGRARARGAPGAAAEHAERALQLTPEDRNEDALRRRLIAAGHHFEAGDAGRARLLLEEAVAEAPPGPRRAEALNQLARAHAFEADLTMAMKLHQEALAEAEEDSSLRAEAEGGLATVLLRTLEDLPAAVRHARRASELAERHGDIHLLSDFLGTQALIEGLLGEPVAVETMQRAASLGRDASEAELPSYYFPRGLWGAGFMAGVLLTWHDAIDDARSALAEARRRAVELGDESSLPLILRWASYAEWLAGDWPEALRLADAGYEVATQAGQMSQQAVLAGTKGLVLAHLGKVDEARAAAEEGCRVSAATGASFGTIVSVSALGFLEFALGNPEGAHGHLGPLADRLEAGGVKEPGATRFVPLEIESLIALDRLAEAEALLERLEERAVKLDRASALSSSRRCRGLLFAAQGNLDRALSELREAVTAAAQAPIPFERARALLALGQVERRAKQRRAARETLQAALARFKELGAGLYVEKAEAELARIGGRTPTQGQLTATEHRLAELVSEGRSNKEVAAALFVTPKTVETKLSRIYQKLGIHSRAELTRLLNEKRMSKL